MSEPPKRLTDVLIKGDDAELTVGTLIGSEMALWLVQYGDMGTAFQARIWLGKKQRDQLIAALTEPTDGD